jgi:tyrosinase
MAVMRSNILDDVTARQKYIQGVKLLKQEFLGPTTSDLGLDGPASPVSTYDLFVVWHHVAMNTLTPPTQPDRNAAHGGPVFLPWHRFMLILLELHLQRVLNDEDFGLPYWDWAADGDLSPDQQVASPVWADDCMGGQGNPVTTGPFAFDKVDASSWRVLLYGDSLTGQLLKSDRSLQRAFGQTRRPTGELIAPTLPRRDHVATALNLETYDAPPWNVQSPGFRNQVEGWVPANSAPSLHNRVHVWVGEDMLRSSSPNDPVFYLNHCNEDRIWAAWLQDNGPTYVPDQTEPDVLRGHRIDDAMHAILSDPLTPRQMLDVDDFYTYDNLVVF